MSQDFEASRDACGALSSGGGGSEATEVGKLRRNGEIVRCRGENGSERGRCAEGYMLTPVLSGG